MVERAACPSAVAVLPRAADPAALPRPAGRPAAAADLLAEQADPVAPFRRADPRPALPVRAALPLAPQGSAGHRQSAAATRRGGPWAGVVAPQAARRDAMPDPMRGPMPTGAHAATPGKGLEGPAAGGLAPEGCLGREDRAGRPGQSGPAVRAWRAG
jgi:hypothetical protein